MTPTLIRSRYRFVPAYLLLTLGAIAAAPTSLAQGHPAVFPGPSNNLFIGFPQTSTIGWAFTVNEALVVNALGVADFFNGPIVPSPPPGDGLVFPHHVTLYTATGAVVADATVPAGTAADYSAPFRYVNITPVTLNPGNYVIGAFYPTESPTSFSDPIAGSFSPTFTSDPALTITGGRVASGGDVFPTSVLTVSFGPNMLISVPEPGAVSLLALAGGLLVRRRRDRR
jgi:hypothetical protein